MRSQAEQLQNRQQHLKEYQEKLRLLIDLLAIIPIDDGSPATALFRTGRLGGTMAMGNATQMMADGTQPANGLSILSLIEAQEEERLRISRQIHDGPTQTLTNLILRAEICERLIDRDVAEARSELRGLKSQINASLQDTRRLIFDLRPMILDDLGLVPTVRRYLVELSRLKGGLQSEVGGPEHDTKLSSTMQVALFRFVQSLLNALLADGSAEHFDVQIAREETAVRIMIDATGLETDRAEIEERLKDSYFQHRLEMLQGAIAVSPRSHRGLSIELMVPVPSDPA
jgi:two-component system sensor histidine kinase DegS